ncbi:Phosphoglycolate phosphatase [Posidoniimonas polymericola]|uniref:Phosphoglycolate phosphatase n=1 Tax=Posidoniimonas polymericola TaxID=2528002 RepID=A0A5C5XTU2_9BACT|nr:HAD family hydrolase [Posidoniimonas polymericola]TWT65445.1 Phosphoglycolate phosphatase [Posidoniimonas polymericola]
MNQLAERIQQLSHPLAPQPTGVEPVLPTLDGVRAVVFDVYGTLLISGSGDISLTSGASHGEAARQAIAACGLEPPADGEAIVQELRAAIARSHAASASEFPEVEIRDIWRETLATVLPNTGLPTIDTGAVDIERLSVEYECRVNPIWPMPGLEETLNALQQAGVTMGVVSNAQFFTPPALAVLAGGEWDVLGIADDLCVWSFAHREAKPGRFLYERATELLHQRGIRPAETLYVGNDMRNDVAPAAAVGFRTALFAGDARSLRLREGDPLVGDRRPDAVVTDLRQIMPILSLADRP